MCGLYLHRKDMRDSLFPKVRKTNPTIRVEQGKRSSSGTPKVPSRNVSHSPEISFGGTPQSSPRGSPRRGSVFGIVTPASRGSQSMYTSDVVRINHRPTSSPSRAVRVSTSPPRSRPPRSTRGVPQMASPPVTGGKAVGPVSPPRSQSPRPPREVIPMASPPAIGGEARVPLRFNATQTTGKLPRRRPTMHTIVCPVAVGHVEFGSDYAPSEKGRTQTPSPAR